MAALQQLECVSSAHPELSEWCSTLRDLFQTKQWHLLTLNLERFLNLPIFQTGDILIQLYHDFITEFELNINLLKLAHFAVIVSVRYAEKEAAISYLEGVIEKLRKTKELCIEQPILYVKMQIALFKLEQGNEKGCEELIEEGKSTLDTMTDIDPSVYASYHSVSSQYHKWRKKSEAFGPKEEDVDEHEGLGSKKQQIEVLHKVGDAEPIGSIIKRLRSRNRRKVNAGNEEDNGGKGEMMTLSEMQMLVTNEFNQRRKKLKDKSTLTEIMENRRDKQKDRDGESGERKEIEHEDQIEGDIGSQKQMGNMEGGNETAAKIQISPLIKVYQRRAKLNLKQKENNREKEKEDSHKEEKVNGHEDVGEDGGRQKKIGARVGGEGTEPDMEEEEKSDKNLDIEKMYKKNEHEEAGGQNRFKEEENETLAKMQMLAKKRLNKGRMKLKQGKEEEHKDERENSCSQEQVEEEVELENENGLEEEIIDVGKRSGAELLDQREENGGRKKQMDEMEGEEMTLAEMRMSAKKKLDQERTQLKDKDKLPMVKKKRQAKDDERDKDNEQKDEKEGSCTQKEIIEQDGEDEKENDEEVATVKVKRKRGRSMTPEVNSLVVGSRTRDQRNRRKTSKLESLEAAKRRGAMEKEIEVEDELYEEEEMTIMNLRKKRARRKPAELRSLEIIKSASKTWMSDAETNESNSDIVAVEDFDFYDFSKDRTGRKFQKGQVWAIYDDKDGMPRHYAVIDEVVSVNPFHVQLNWLDIQDTGDKASTSREKMGLPVACGSFKVSLSVTIKSRKIFSHIADFERAARELYKIYPKKGSVWAMFNKKSSGAGGLNITTEKGSRYDIVVFLTSYSEVYGLSMAYLERVDGFKTVYKRREIGARAIKILEGDDFRLFSHHIPARRLSGEEVSGLPKDCWELDPASLPESLAIGYEA